MVNAVLWYNVLSPREQLGEGQSTFRGVCDLINVIYLEGMRIKPCPGTRTYSAKNPAKFNPAKFSKLFLLCTSWAHFAGCSPSLTPVQSDCSHDGSSLWTFADKAWVWTHVSTRQWKSIPYHNNLDPYGNNLWLLFLFVLMCLAVWHFLLVPSVFPLSMTSEMVFPVCSPSLLPSWGW